jgi:hypothetical protein
MGKNFINLKMGDTIYWLSMEDSEFNESDGSCIKKLIFDNAIRTADMFSMSIRTKNNTYFSVNPTTDVCLLMTNYNDEINLSFDIYATSVEAAVNKAREVIHDRNNVLSLIKKRVNESETGLLLAQASLDMVEEQQDEVSLEEFASMALG